MTMPAPRKATSSPRLDITVATMRFPASRPAAARCAALTPVMAWASSMRCRSAAGPPVGAVHDDPQPRRRHRGDGGDEVGVALHGVGQFLGAAVLRPGGAAEGVAGGRTLRRGAP